MILKEKILYLKGILPYGTKSLSNLSLVIFTILMHPPEEESRDIAKETAKIFQNITIAFQ